MTKDKFAGRQELENGLGAPPAANSTDARATDVYAACMSVYRWMSRRYRKTLDALAK